MTHVWGVMERLRESLDPGDTEDCESALRNALTAIFQLDFFGLIAADPLLMTQLMAICLRIGSENSLKLWEGLEADLRSSYDAKAFARAYYETRALHLREVSIFLDRSLTAVREQLGDMSDGDRGKYWAEIFEQIDEVRRSGQAPMTGPIWQRPKLIVPGMDRGKYGGPLRENVPYGTPMHRVAIVDGEQVDNPHLLNVLARSVKWNHGRRPDPAGTVRRADHS